MTNKTTEKLIYIVVIGILVVIYAYCNILAERGQGYPGYRGYHHRHSFWYVRHYDHNYYQSNRESSVGGNGFSKRGLSGGK